MDTTSTTSLETLFQTYKLGNSLTLPNKFVMASLTRIRCDPKTGIPNDLLVEYYAQRASAGLILTECSPIAHNGNSLLGAAAIYNQDQVEGWKKVTDAVHKKGGRIYLQIWHAGRAADPNLVGGETLAPSAIAIRSLRKNMPYAQPKEMTKEDIEKVLEQFKQGALNAKAAGFDGIEAHGANGYLIDQFLKDGVNQRTDEYGGSIENRCRFPLEVMDRLIEVFGAEKVGIKLSPVGRFQDMYDSDPVALYSYFLKELDKRGVSYVQLMEPNEGYAGEIFHEKGDKQIAEVCKTFRPHFKGTIIINNNLTPETAAKAVNEGYADLASFGKYFISNPDFVERVQNGWGYNDWDHTTFSSGGEKGYTDYPFYKSN